jgi:hypothetical protein
MKVELQAAFDAAHAIHESPRADRTALNAVVRAELRKLSVPDLEDAADTFKRLGAIADRVIESELSR